jgi:hypothetical protein
MRCGALLLVEPHWLFLVSIALQALISHTQHDGSVLVNYPGTLSVPRLVTRHSHIFACHSLLVSLSSSRSVELAVHDWS